MSAVDFVTSCQSSFTTLPQDRVTVKVDVYVDNTLRLIMSSANLFLPPGLRDSFSYGKIKTFKGFCGDWGKDGLD